MNKRTDPDTIKRSDMVVKKIVWVISPVGGTDFGGITGTVGITAIMVGVGVGEGASVGVATAAVGVGVGVTVPVTEGAGLAIAVGAGVAVGVGEGASVAEGVALSAICDPDAKTVKDVVVVLSKPSASFAVIEIVCAPAPSAIAGLYAQLPFGSVLTSTLIVSERMIICTKLLGAAVPRNCGRSSVSFWSFFGVVIFTSVFFGPSGIDKSDEGVPTGTLSSLAVKE